MPTRTLLLLLALLCALAGPTASAAGEFAAEQLAPSAESIPHLGPLDSGEFSPPQLPQIYDDSITREMVDGGPDARGMHSAGASYDDSGEPYSWQLMPQGLIYRSYLAGAKESRFRSVWNNDRNDGNIWDIGLGGNVGLLRYGTSGNRRPEGFQLGIEGAGQVRLDIDENRDVDAADFRFGVPLTWGDAVHQVKFAFYHLSSHVGDEFLLKNVGFNRFNYSRNALVLGESLYPSENLRVYGEIGYGVDCDVCDPWELQFGVDWAPNGNTGARGAPFAAVNGHLREEVDYGGNFVAQTGWAWRRSPASGMYRLGVEYYNGKDDQFSFFNQSVQKVGFGMWYDY